MGEGLVSLLLLPSLCCVAAVVLYPSLVVLWVGMKFVIVGFPDHTVKPVLSNLSKRPKIGFQDRLLNAGLKYCIMLQESILQYY